MSDFERLGAELAKEQDAIRARKADRELARSGFLYADVRGRSRAWPRPAWVVGGASALAAAAAIMVWMNSSDDALIATIGSTGQTASVGQMVRSQTDESLPIEFSDGTEMKLAPASELELLELDARGAHVQLHQGRARVSVTPLEHARWQLSMGPYLVRVTGTRFDVAWTPDQDLFELELQEGQVELVGCGFGSGKQLAAGQAVRASCERGELEVSYADQSDGAHEQAMASDSDAEEATAAPSKLVDHAKPEDAPGADSTRDGEARDATPDQNSPSVLTSSQRTGDAAGARDAEPGTREGRVWLRLARRGLYAEAYAAADVEGFDAECQSAQSGELMLLADTARHAGKLQQALRAYRAVRRRFSGSNNAALAAFSLGRLHFDALGAYSESATWFRRYLRERPSGSLRREAKGRLLEALHRSGRADGARQQAVDYLKEYPSGPHAALAERLTESP